MNAPVMRRTTCRLCNSADLHKILFFGETPLANAFRLPSDTSPEVFAPLVVNMCGRCKLVQLRDVVDPSVLFRNYLYVSGTSVSFVAHFAAYAKSVAERFKLTNDSLVVDIGSNDGVLLSQFKELGTKILGVDPAEDIATQASARGIPTVAAFFTSDVATEIEKTHGKASIITANNVFAHTDDVMLFASTVRELLQEDGVFIFEVQYLKDLVEKNLFDIVYHEHLCYYHLMPLIPFFDKLGMRVFDVERVETHGGSIRVFVGHTSGPHERAESVARMLESEKELGRVETYQRFAKRIKENGTKLRALLTELKKNGKRIVGYGAPAKATTLCYAFGIDSSLLDFIVDDSSLKQGRLMPGTHIPIRAANALYEERPDYCLILAWNFAGEIMRAHEKFKASGGSFILPVPEVRIV